MGNRSPANAKVIEDLRQLAADYRRWAEEPSGNKSAEYLRLADDVDKTIGELERQFRTN
jgi:hypothetical protein